MENDFGQGSGSPKSFIYKDSTIAFVTAAVQACLLMEKCSEYEVEEWREQMLRLLPVLYLRTRLVEQEEPMLDEEPQRFVTEEDYNYALVGIRNLLGQDDAYLDVFVDRGIYTDEVQTAYISEGLADIYQELYNLVASVRDVESEAIHSILITCKEDFAQFWGQTLCNVLRALHSVFYNHDEQ